MVIIIPLLVLLGDFLINTFYPLHIDAGISVSRGERVYYMITFGGVLCTLAAVIVALFGRDIEEVFCRPQFEASLLPTNNLGMESNENGNQLNVKRYFRNIVITNKGKQQAVDCELFIESIKIENGRTLFEEENYKWNGDKEKVYIPAGGHRSFCLIEIKQPIEQGNPTANNHANVEEVQQNLATYIICGREIDSLIRDNIIVKIVIYSPSLQRQFEKVFTIRWDGQWTPNRDRMRVDIN